MQNFEEMSSKQSNAELCNGYVFLRQMHLICGRKYAPNMWKKQACHIYVISEMYAESCTKNT